jgi:hypothetical protein
MYVCIYVDKAYFSKKLQDVDVQGIHNCPFLIFDWDVI